MKTHNVKNVKCNKNVTFQDCELAILRSAVDLAETKMGSRLVNTPEIKKMVEILENFLRKKSLVCYGGQSINEELPEADRFYNKDVDIPDYDFYSANALEDAKELANIYYDKGYKEVECKSGQHHGTYKVYVNFIPIADISYIPKKLFDVIKKDSMRIHGILYAPPNFLKMGMYLELSRPAGDISRWEKVLKRLTIFNKHYPLTSIDCNTINYQREMSDTKHQDEIYENVKDTFINQGCVFFGGYANTLYSQYMPKQSQKHLEKIADFDVLSNDPETTAEIVKERLKDIGITNVKIIKREPVGEIVPIHFEIKIGADTIAFVYKPIACHSYNVLTIHGQKVKIATIDTMLSFYLAFLYSDRPYYNEFSDRILCMAKFLFDVQQKNRLEQKGLLRRFSITCYGHQESVEEMRAHKSEKFKELSSKRGTKEYDEWFLNYRPDQKHKIYTNKNYTNTNKNYTNTNMNNNNMNNNNITNQMNMKPKKTKTNPKTKTKTKTKKTNKTKTKKTFFDIYGRKTRKNKKGAIY